MTISAFKMRYRSSGGFTLVELLVVISLLGILTGVTLSIINPKKQRQAAEDSVRQSNLEKYALGIEAYANVNAGYPVTLAFDAATKIPVDAEVANFISKVPKDEPTSPLDYTYSGSADGSAFGVYVVKASDAAACYKYTSTWGRIKECTPLVNCPGYANVCI
jgi:prepilin-type N-terminal cleavage/methylation domain-containing protein